MRTGLEVGATSPRPAGAGRDLGPADARREGRETAPVPRPRPGLRDTPRLAAGHLRARHVLPPRPAPRVPPGLGAVTGGRGGTRRARRLEAWAGEAGRGGKERATRCVGQRCSGQSVIGGAPRPGVGRRQESCPEAAGRGRADRLVPAAGWGPFGVWRACHSGRKVGPRAVPANFPKGPVPAPRGSLSIRARCPRRRGWVVPRRRWRGGFQECADGIGAFRISAPCHP